MRCRLPSIWWPRGWYKPNQCYPKGPERPEFSRCSGPFIFFKRAGLLREAAGKLLALNG